MANCDSKEKVASYAEEEEIIMDEESKLFMACFDSIATNESGVWFLDSGCSNHMYGVKLAFKDIDESEKKLVMLGDNKPVQVEGKGSVAVKTSHGVSCTLPKAPKRDLGAGTSSLGKLFPRLFDDGVCMIEDKKSGQIMASVRMAKNMIFPLEVSNVGKKVLVASERNATNLWHLRYGHLNVKALKLLNQKGMVHGLPNINTLDKLCEGCIHGKQCRKSFSIRKAWRALGVLR
ncbi:hypothetical protein RJ639_032356 [Escallonia herrerae]|uniref:GAG-pre-integrase domain-containing protein n=1 Tax=Escallonia herrerae TaxID=1293975 RepID=A0AA88WVK5_9ASTE|nr:hypothetical protein RJ639_032356 [Escallonia herrerae]